MEDLGLELDTRRRLYETVCKYPGTHMRELARILDMRLNLVDYHLHYLEKRDLVYATEDGEYKRYYPRDSLDKMNRRDLTSAPDKPIVGMLRQPLPFRIIVLLAKHGTSTHKELTVSLRRAPSTVSHHLEKLTKAGIVVTVDQGRGYALSDQARIERILLAFTPQPTSLTEGFIEIWESLEL